MSSNSTAGYEFVKELVDNTRLGVHSDPELNKLFSLIPNELVAEIQAGYGLFFLSPSHNEFPLLSQAHYGGAAQTDRIRLTIIDPAIGYDEDGAESTFQFKIRFSANMDYSTGELQLFGGSRKSNPNVNWIKGFNSNQLEVPLTSDLFSKEEWKLLRDYEARWADAIAQFGPAGNYNKQRAQDRLYLAAARPDAVFTFSLEARVNPTDAEKLKYDPTNPDLYPLVPGIQEPNWSGMTVVQQQRGGITTRPGQAPVVTKVKAVDLSNFTIPRKGLAQIEHDTPMSLMPTRGMRSL